MLPDFGMLIDYILLFGIPELPHCVQRRYFSYLLVLFTDALGPVQELGLETRVNDLFDNLSTKEEKRVGIL